tara:strand:+ start:3412 stop:4566 length:1155 start_codon:yes stop_codon:yes gene_type:complete
MDLYGLDSARATGNALTQSNDLYNEQIRSSRDRINNSLDAENITAQGNLRAQQSTNLQDKVIYDVHDAVSGANLASSYNRLGESMNAYNKATSSGVKGGFGTFISSQRALSRGDVDTTFASAKQTGDKVAGATTNEVERVRQQTSSALASRTPAPAQTALERLNQQESKSQRGGLSSVPESDDGSAPAGAIFRNRKVQNETLAGSANTPEVNTKPPVSAAEELSGKVLDTSEKLRKGAGIAGKGLRAVGDVGGAIGTYEMIKNGFTKNKDGSTDRLNEVSQIAGTIGTGLDIVGAFIPALEPLGQAVQAVGAIADTIDTHEKDDAATTAANTDISNVDSQRKSQLAALPSEKSSSPPVNSMVSAGLVGSQSQHINNTTQGTGAF